MFAILVFPYLKQTLAGQIVCIMGTRGEGSEFVLEGRESN